MQHNAVIIDNISMCFNMSKERISGLKEYIIKFCKRQLHFEQFWALHDISFVIKKGEVFGIVGLNGSGKSTLLKIIAGVLKPTTGKVIVHGTIAPLIELGAGFDMELTAKENIYLNGAVLGYSKKEMEKHYDEIICFSELEDFVDVPLKNFSSGMIARLGFSIATIVRPDVLIVDEILSVGDFLFQEKCEQRINTMMKSGTTVIIVSHSIEQIERLCDRVLWLEKGKMKDVDAVEHICKKYKQQ